MSELPDIFGGDIPASGASGEPDLASMLGGLDLGSLMQQAQNMQAQMMQAQNELANMQFSGNAGGDLVTATVSGKGELVALQIKPAAADPQDTALLADLIIAAVREASSKAAKVAQAAVPQIPGL